MAPMSAPTKPPFCAIVRFLALMLVFFVAIFRNELACRRSCCLRLGVSRMLPFKILWAHSDSKSIKSASATFMIDRATLGDAFARRRKTVACFLSRDAITHTRTHARPDR